MSLVELDLQLTLADIAKALAAELLGVESTTDRLLAWNEFKRSVVAQAFTDVNWPKA